jgi:hypothetical protein
MISIFLNAAFQLSALATICLSLIFEKFESWEWDFENFVKDHVIQISLSVIILKELYLFPIVRSKHHCREPILFIIKFLFLRKSYVCSKWILKMIRTRQILVQVGLKATDVFLLPFVVTVYISHCSYTHLFF